MTDASDLHDMPYATALEQVTRWAINDGWGPGDIAASAPTGDEQQRPLDGVTVALAAASRGIADEFRPAVTTLAEHDGPNSRAAALQATLRGDGDAANDALADNRGLRALLQTAAERAAGIDSAQIATPNGLRLRAEQTGECYETGVLMEDAPGRSDVLASSTILAATAADALRAAAERERAIGGLDQTDLTQIEQQLTRLEVLLGANTSTTPDRVPMTEPLRASTPATLAQDAGWTDLGWYEQAPDAALQRHTPDLYRQWQEHDGDPGVQSAAAQRIWNVFEYLESAHRVSNGEALSFGIQQWTVEDFQHKAQVAASPLSPQEIERVTSAGPEFNFWRDVIGDDLVVGGVAYDRHEWRSDGEGGVEQIPADRRPQNDPIGESFIARFPRISAELNVSAGHEAQGQAEPTAANTAERQTTMRQAAETPGPEAGLQLAAAVTRCDLRSDPAAIVLENTLAGAAAAGWDLATHLPELAAQGPLNETHPAQDLAYRVMDACPDAVSAAPSVTQIKSTRAVSTGRQREAAERAITPTPTPDRGPSVGR